MARYPKTMPISFSAFFISVSIELGLSGIEVITDIAGSC
jgi:hypothetical protein